MLDIAMRNSGGIRALQLPVAALRVFRISYTTLFYDFKNTWTSCAFTNLLVMTMPIQQLIDHRVFYLFCPSRTVFLLHERSSTTVPSLAHKI